MIDLSVLEAVVWGIDDPTNKTVVLHDSLLWISLMKIRKNNGPKTVPCGKQDVTETSSDLTPSRTTR